MAGTIALAGIGLDVLQFTPAGWLSDAAKAARLAKGADAAITAASDADKLVAAASDADKLVAAADEAVSAAGGSGIPADRPFFPESEQLPYTSSGALHGQMQSGSCLAACARMVLADAGVELPETWIRNAASIDATEGGFLRDLPTAFKRLGGPDATYVEGGTIADLQRVTASGGPVIASVKTSLGRHGLIVDAFEESDIGTLVSIRDPLPMGQGTSYQVLMETFTQAWTKSFIHFQP